jgi:uncharacterized protein
MHFALKLVFRARSAFVTLAILLAACASVSGGGSSPALWMIKDQDSTIYLFGTIHALRPDVSWLSQKTLDAMNASDEFYSEVAVLPSDEQKAALDAAVARYAQSTHGPVSQLLSPEEYRKLVSIAPQANISEKMLTTGRPWVLSLALSRAGAEQVGYDRSLGVESLLIDRFARRHIPTKGMESLEQSASVFSALTHEQEIALLRQSIANYGRPPPALGPMVASWAKGDLAQMATIQERQLRTMPPALRDALVSKRNAAWAEKIGAMLDGTGTTFIAVGAAHLVGADSVQDLLQAKGIKSTRIN